MIPVNPAIVGIEAVNPTEPLIPVSNIFLLFTVYIHIAGKFCATSI